MPVRLDGRAASSTDPATWMPHCRVKSTGPRIGFVLGDGVGCIDLDHCLDDGRVADWARAILDQVPPTYMEVSPSGDGLHVWGLLPEGAGRVVRDGRNVEVYSSGRFMTVTGRRWGLSPSRLADLTEVVANL